MFTGIKEPTKVDGHDALLQKEPADENDVRDGDEWAEDGHFHLKVDAVDNAYALRHQTRHHPDSDPKAETRRIEGLVRHEEDDRHVDDAVQDFESEIHGGFGQIKGL